MTRDYICHHWAILRCSVYADWQLGPIVTITITHNVTRSWESLFWKGKHFLNLDFSCFLCCLYLISAKHTDCMNSYQFSTVDGKRRLKKWYNCTRGCLVQTEPEEKAMFTWRVGVTYLHTKECLWLPGNHPQLGRSKGGSLPIFKGFMVLPTPWFEFYPPELWDNTFQLWGTLQQPWKTNAVENYKWTSSMLLPETLSFDFGYLGIVFSNIP